MLSRKLRKRQAEDAPQTDSAPRQPPAKLSKRTAVAARRGPSVALRVRESALFRPVRAIGVVTDGVPFAPTTLGDADFVTVSIGRGFQIFECDKLRLAYLGPRLNEKVRALACVGDVTLTALGSDIVAWNKLVELGRFRGHTGTATLMCAVGTGYLVSAAGREALVWKLNDIGLESVVEAAGSRGGDHVLAPLGRLALAKDFGDCTALCHLPTYIHKVVVASSAGGLELWNVRSRELVHTFKAHLAKLDDTGGGGITCMVEVPNVLDLLALGFASGRISILHAREDRVVVEFDQAQGRVTALTFRTGPSAPRHLVSGAPNGTLVVWDLDKRRAHKVLEGAHHGPIVSAHFLPNQSLLLTSGRDNAIRMWIFDSVDGYPRLLKSRCGCPGPARRMVFYGSEDHELIVGGGRESGGFLAKVSFIQDHQNTEYSQGALQKMPNSVKNFQFNLAHSRLPPIVDLAFCEARHYDWPAVITAHAQTASVFLWSAFHRALAPRVLRPPEDQCAPVSVVAISPCGNYCVVGLENGALHRFNLQSSLHRGPIPKPPSQVDPATGKAKKQGPPEHAHRGRVCGVVINVSGQVITAASHPRDCCVKVWDLMTHEAVASVELNGKRPGSPSCLLLRAHGSLVAASLDDGGLLVVDLQGKAVVRTFTCGVPATDIAFTPDARWLAAALRDGGLRIFDLPAARCIDAFVFAKPALSLCFSPSSAFLLTSHSKGNAVQVWANKFLFDPSLSAPLLRPEPTTPMLVDEPGDPGEDEEPDEEKGEAGGTPRAPSAKTPAVAVVKPLEPELMTLSDVPAAKWMATLHLDLVKERNKPVEPPKPLPNAPFFLPTAHEGVRPRFVAPAEGDDDEDGGLGAGAGASAPSSRHLRDESSIGLSGMPLQALLRKGSYDEALTFLKKQTPSGVHIAIEELGPLAGGDTDELGAGLKFFMHHLKQSHYADELQAYLSLFLQAHGEELTEVPELRDLCDELCRMQENAWTALNARCRKARCFLGMLTHTQSQW